MDFLVWFHLAVSPFFNLSPVRPFPSTPATSSDGQDKCRCWNGWTVAGPAFYYHLFWSLFIVSTGESTPTFPDDLGFSLMADHRRVSKREKINKTSHAKSRLVPCSQWLDCKSSASLYGDGDCPARASLLRFYAFKISLSWDLSFHRDCYSTRDPAVV